MTGEWMWLIITDGKVTYTVTDASKDYHTKHGYFRKEDFAKADGTIMTSTGVKFLLFPARPHDRLARMARHAQIVRPKDVGAIIAYAGITRDSTVIDAGAGSGALAVRLGLIAKKVVTYDIDDRSIMATTKNVELLCLHNVAVKKKDAYSGFDERHADVVVLDLPEPWRAIASASASLLPGGTLVSYSPHVMQCQQMVVACRDAHFVHERTIELIERNWVLDEERSRPDFKGLGHTGFLNFFRKTRKI